MSSPKNIKNLTRSASIAPCGPGTSFHSAAAGGVKCDTDSDMDITKDELMAILGRCNATTEGPWVSFVEGRDHTSRSDFIKTAKGDIELSGATVADQGFIAAAKTDLPRLVSIIANHYGWAL